MTADRQAPVPDFAGLYYPGLRITPEPFVAQLNLRTSDPAGVSAATGISLPVEPNTVARTGGASALWLGPDEWLIVGADPPATGPDRVIVDVSAQHTTFVLSGPLGPELLAFGCALDLSGLTVGRCAQTMLARAAVLLWASDVDELRVLVRPSFARYLVAWFADAATEFGPVRS